MQCNRGRSTRFGIQGLVSNGLMLILEGISIIRWISENKSENLKLKT